MSRGTVAEQCEFDEDVKLTKFNSFTGRRNKVKTMYVQKAKPASQPALMFAVE
jgi:hypothetical protein